MIGTFFVCFVLASPSWPCEESRVAGSYGVADESAAAQVTRGQSQEQAAGSGSGTIRWGCALLLREQERWVSARMKGTGTRVTR